MKESMVSENRRRLVTCVALALVGALTLSSCHDDADKGSQPSSSPSKKTAMKKDGLDDLFNDSDGDFVPDRVQRSLGEDATKDTCASNVCKKESEAHNAALAKIVRGTSTMIVLDSSGSMAGKTKDGQSRMAAAKKAIRNYVDNAPTSTERLGMMVYGHSGSNKRRDRAESCKKIDTPEAIGDLSKSNVDGTLAKYEPTGWTPIGRSLHEASTKFGNERNRVNRIIVVTDGIEECGGDPQAEAQQLRRSGFNVRIDMVGVGMKNGSPDAKTTANVAKAGGGTFTAVADTAGMENYFDQQLGQWVATAKLGDCVAKNFADYSSCQALRWQRAQGKLDGEIQKLRDEGKDTSADELQNRVNEASEYFLTTLSTEGLSRAKEFTPSSAEVKRIQDHLAKTGHGRAILKANDIPCN